MPGSIAKAGGSILMASLVGWSLSVNVARANTGGAAGLAPVPTAHVCRAVPLTSSQMQGIRGAGLIGWLQDAAAGVTAGIDEGCALAGVAGALGAALDPVGAAFCAGWGVGRLL
jgi:hypothetical protein